MKVANYSTPGFGFHGDFLNGWDPNVQTAAIAQCAGTADGVIADCPPLAAVDDQHTSGDCPEQPQLVNEPTRGMIDKLPGCITITPGPEEATSADMNCPPGTVPPTVN